MHIIRHVVPVLAAVTSVALVVTSPTGPGGPTGPGDPAHPRAPWSAVPPRADDRRVVAAALSTLRILPRRTRVLGYDRELFGVWGPSPAKGVGCTTRDAVVLRVFPRSLTSRRSGCPRATGTTTDAYTHAEVTPDEVDIDHVFPLSAAWDLGADAWDGPTRRRFGNDTARNLVVTASAVNRAKSDGTLGEWLPPAADARCPYAARYLTVAGEYGLAVTTADADAARRACSP
ncbi:HNH endonuclease family protein [Corynebacterium bovis]|uniref:HNH endonuclease family protein n=1 Tax=Corynebacterium bovis TaxID=36808 RepID=UPI0031395FEF